MKNTLKTTAALLIIIGAASSAYAGGKHSEGHGAKKDMAKMDAHWASPKEASAKANPIAATANSVALGAKLYQNNCASCHGKNAMGDGPTAAYLTPKPTNLVAMAGSHPDGDFAWKIQNGRGAMPGWKGKLSESEIWNTVNFIQSLKSPAKTKSKKKSEGHGHG